MKILKEKVEECKFKVGRNTYFFVEKYYRKCYNSSSKSTKKDNKTILYVMIISLIVNICELGVIVYLVKFKK